MVDWQFHFHCKNLKENSGFSKYKFVCETFPEEIKWCHIYTNGYYYVKEVDMIQCWWRNCSDQLLCCLKLSTQHVKRIKNIS